MEWLIVYRPIPKQKANGDRRDTIEQPLRDHPEAIAVRV